ncbi:MAG: S41 family peptidase, partial [bacterium]
GPAVLDSAIKRAVVDSLAGLLERLYPAPDTGRMIADRVRGQEQIGAYALLTSKPQFAEALTRDLRLVNSDKHLSVRIGEERRAAAGGAQGTDAQDGADNVGTPQVLENNVGYLKIGTLAGSPRALARLGDALRVLEKTDAVIVDLRGSPGGSAEMANTIISHFVAPGVPVIRVYDRSSGRTFVRETLTQVSGPRRLDVPLYVLVDARSASAAEDVPFVLQNLGRATIIGERTAGAGRNNRTIALSDGLLASISITRVSEPTTGREWEGVGVKPDVEVASDSARDVALRAALARIRTRKP